MARGQWECMKWIMEEEKRTPNKEKEVHCDGRDDFNILQHAIQNTNWEEDPVVLWELIKTRKFKISEPDKQGLNTSLHLAAQFDRQDDHILLEAFLPSDDKNKDYHSQDYIKQEDLEECIATENNVGMTPLHFAARHGQLEVCKLIMDNVVDKNPADIQGLTPRQMAKSKGYYKLYVIMLLKCIRSQLSCIF